MGLYSSHQSFQPQTYQRFDSLCLLTTTVLFVPLHPSGVFVFLSHDMPPPDSKHLPWRVCIKTHGHDVSDMSCLCLNITICCFISLSQNWEQTGNKLKRRPRRRRFFKKDIQGVLQPSNQTLCVAWRSENWQFEHQFVLPNGRRDITASQRTNARCQLL